MSRNMKTLLTLLLILALSTGALASELSVKLSSDARFYQSASTSSKSVKLKKGTKVTLKDTRDEWGKVRYKGVTGYMKLKYLTSARDSSGSSQSSSWKSKVVKLNWYDGGSSLLKKGHYGYLYDIDTGLTVRIKRMGGSNHADCEPATKADTAKLKKIAGGSFSWDSQAVILRVGSKFVACAINTMPHGEQTISDNSFPGQFCLHMTGSKTHGTDSVNESHQKAIDRAYRWAH